MKKYALLILFMPTVYWMMDAYHSYRPRETLCYDRDAMQQVSCSKRAKREVQLQDVEMIPELEQMFPYTNLSYHIGVLSSWKFRSTRMSALYHTWGKEAADMNLYVGRTSQDVSNDKHVRHLPIRVLTDVEDSVYPPQEKAFKMMQYWCDHLIDKYQWFIRADDDIYLKIFQLERLLYSLNHTKKYYIGRSGQGLPFEQRKLGLTGNRFCCGPTVIYSRPALQALCPHIAECANATVSSHEDTEVGRCVIQHLGIQCADNHGYPELKELFFHKYTKVEPSLLRGDLSAESFFLKAISIHEVKEQDVMYNLAYNDLFTREMINRYKKPMLQMSNPLHIHQPKAVNRPPHRIYHRRKKKSKYIFS